MNLELIDYHCVNFYKLLVLKSKEIGLKDDESYILLVMLSLDELRIRPITPDKISKYVTMPITDIDKIMIKLINKNYIARRQGTLDFTPLYRLLLNEKESHEEKTKQYNLVESFEDAFGRTLSSTEIEFINDYKRSGFDDETIIQALKEAVKANVIKFRYIEKILENWRQYGKKIRRKEENNSLDVSDEIKNYNWWDQ